MTPAAPASLACAGRAQEQVYLIIPVTRVLRVCAGPRSGDGVTLNSADCRPVACACAGDCPTPFSCANGLCQVPSAPVALDDVASLCAASTPWAATCEQFVEGQGRLFEVLTKAMGRLPLPDWLQGPGEPPAALTTACSFARSPSRSFPCQRSRAAAAATAPATTQPARRRQARRR
jgi:hypothetical protein